MGQCDWPPIISFHEISMQPVGKDDYRHQLPVIDRRNSYWRSAPYPPVLEPILLLARRLLTRISHHGMIGRNRYQNRNRKQGN
jgi:hypothetical protein